MKRETASDSMDGRENGHGAFGEEIISDLRRIPGVGENMEHHLQNIGIRCVEDLVGKDPEELYHLDCLKKGFQDDRCVLYVYRCAVYFAEHEQHDPEKTLRAKQPKTEKHPGNYQSVRDSYSGQRSAAKGGSGCL